MLLVKQDVQELWSGKWDRDVYRLVDNGLSYQQIELMLLLTALVEDRQREADSLVLVEVEDRNSVVEGFEFRDVLEAFRGKRFVSADEPFVIDEVVEEDGRVAEYTSPDPWGTRWSSDEQFAADYLEAVSV